MQQSKGTVGHSKHYLAFGKSPKNRSVGLAIEKLVNDEQDRANAIKKARKGKQYASVRELFDKEK